MSYNPIIQFVTELVLKKGNGLATCYQPLFAELCFVSNNFLQI